MYFIAQLLDIYALGLLVYVVLSWIESPGAIKARQWLGRFYEPLLNPLRGMLRSINLSSVSLDLSPIALFILIIIVRRILLSF